MVVARVVQQARWESETAAQFQGVTTVAPPRFSKRHVDAYFAVRPPGP